MQRGIGARYALRFTRLPIATFDRHAPADFSYNPDDSRAGAIFCLTYHVASFFRC